METKQFCFEGRIITRLECSIPGALFPETFSVDFPNLTIEEVSQTLGEHVYAMQLYSCVQGTMVIEGQLIKLNSSRFNVGPMIYRGGTQYGRAEIEALDIEEQTKRELLHMLSDFGADQLLQFTDGHFVPFFPEKGERNLT